MVSLSSAEPVAEADPEAEANVYVNVHQNVGEILDSPDAEAPEEEEVEIPTTEADDELFTINGQTFKFFSLNLTFDEALEVCSNAGLQMAEPDDSTALELQKI